MAATTIPPSQPTNLRMVSHTANSVTLAWNWPATGTPPYTYRLLYVQDGTTQWYLGLTTVAHLTGVLPLPKRGTGYSVCVTATN